MKKRAMTDEAKELKSQMILDKAAEMILDQDFHEIKMKDIAKEIGISNGILFVYFKTKETLFFCLLCREYEERFNRLKQWVEKMSLTSFEDFKNLVMGELNELVDNHPLYIRLEAMRSAIFEKNIDPDIMMKYKVELYYQMKELCTLISEDTPLSVEEIDNIFEIEGAIITGCKLTEGYTFTSEFYSQLFDGEELKTFKRDFKEDVTTIMSNYLDGYSRSLVNN